MFVRRLLLGRARASPASPWPSRPLAQFEPLVVEVTRAQLLNNSGCFLARERPLGTRARATKFDDGARWRAAWDPRVHWLQFLAA